MKFAKKSLSVLLSLLMIFTACSIGFDGIIASAAEGDSEYSKEDVAALINAATASGFNITSSGDAWVYTADDGKAIEAARAIFDYAVNTYREGKEATSAGNSTASLEEKFNATFGSMYTNPTAAKQLVKNVLNPTGTTVYSYENPGKKTDVKGAETTTSMSAGSDVSGTYPVASYPGYYASSVTGIITKTSEIQIDWEKYLLAFEKIEDIPSTIITGVKYTYAHTYSSSAKVSSVETRDETTGSGCNASTTTYYTPVIETSYWNYMTSKPTKTETKDKTIRKTLLTLEKYFNDELFSITKDDMLAMSLEDITSLYKTTELMYGNIFTDSTLKTRKFSDTVLTHFGLRTADIHQFMTDVYFAYRVVAAKYNIDNLNTLIGSEYNEDSYAEMSALYAKTRTAYNTVFSLDAEIVSYLINEGGYGDQYNKAIALKATAESYNAVLFDVMTEQKLEETVAAMVKTYTDYINVLNKEDIDTPSDAEVIGLVQKVDAFDAVIASYTGKSYYRTYWTTEYESEWARFSGILDEVYEVRGLKMDFETYYDYFLPIIYTTMIDEMNNEDAIALHRDLETKLGELRTSYSEVAAKWGYTIADKIFTVSYEGSDYLLQTLVDSVKSAGKEAAKTVLIARNDAQLDTIWAYHGVTTVDFSNFASIKSTLTYFDYDLYNYVSEQGWLTSDATTKYADVQTLLDRYHAFSTTDGKAFFDESFTFADEDGNYVVRYPAQVPPSDAPEYSIGYPNDIAREEDDGEYVVNEGLMLETIKRLDDFVISRDFGALLGFVSTETEEYCDLETYVTEMLNEMLFTDDLINTLVGAIYPMVVDLLNTELVGMLADMGVNDNPNASACIDIGEMTGGDGSGHLYVYMDDDLFNGAQKQRYLDVVLADAGLYVYPQTLADSLLMSNPVAYGVGTPIYTALKAAGRDWTKLVCEDNPETQEDETKVLDFEWGVYDAETFTDALGVIFDSLLPLLNAVLTGTNFNETLANAAYGYSTDTKYIVSVGKLAVFCDLNLQIPGLTVFNDVLVPLFEILGVDKIPTLKSGASGDEIAQAIVKPLLGVIDEVLANPISTVLDILPNLVYFLSMDSVQEIIDSLNISLNLKLEPEVDKDNSGTLVDLLGGTLFNLLEDKLTFPVELAISDMLDLYDMLGFEISDFNEVLEFVVPMLGIEGLELPPIKQQEIIFCSDWSTSPTGRVYLSANEGDLLYWLLNYIASALVPDENGNSLLTGLLGSDMDPAITGLLNQSVSQLSGNPRGFLAAIMELLNPRAYELDEMDWAESQYNYNGITGATPMTNVYLSYGNDWTKDDADYLVDNIDELVANILTMVEMDLGGAENLGAYLQDTVNALFTNDNITALVEMLGGLGDSPSGIIADIFGEQIGIDLSEWFVAFGYLYDADTWAEDAEIIPLGHRTYVNNFGVEGVRNEDGTISWFFNKMPLNDGDGYTFINIVTRLLGGVEILVEFLLAGETISAFGDLVKLLGYETYDTTLGLLLEYLGVENLPSQADFNADAMGSLTNMLVAVLDWFYALTSSEDMIEQLLEIIPDLFYFIESNGLSVILKNLLKPVLVLVDTVRPLINLDINGTLSILLTELINYGTLDTDVLLQYITNGIYLNDDPECKFISIDIDNLRLSDIIKIVDGYLGTNLEASGLVELGLKGVCSGVVEEDTYAVGKINRTTVDAADTMTLLVTGLLDCLSQPAKDPQKTNGDVIFELVAELAENEKLATLYPTIAAVIAGIDVEYGNPDWGYMFETPDQFTVVLPEPSITYLSYSTDWTEEAANGVYESLDEILELVLPSLLEEGETLATLLNGMIADSVYSDEILVDLVELIVNALAEFNTFFGLVDGLLGTTVTDWYAEDFCQYDEEAEAWVCVKDFGVDAAAEADKKDVFIAGLKEVINPANALLAWVFFGDSYEFFTGSDVDGDGEYVYNSLITLNGGEGYAYGLVPILEALGCEMKPASAYYDEATDTYNVGNAVEDIINAVFGLIDSLTDADNTVELVFDLLPNLIYFINADGLKVSVNNLLAPVNGILEALSPILSDDGSTMSLSALLEESIGLDISDLTTETLLGIAADNNVTLSADMVDIICNLYVGQLELFTSANGRDAYRLNVEGYEGDVLTIVLSIALELFTLNRELFSDLLGEDVYNSVYGLIKGATDEFEYKTSNWAYMYEDTDEKTALEQLQGTSDTMNKYMPPYAEGSTAAIYLQYQNNWNDETAEYVDEILDALVDSFFEGDSSLGQLLDDAVTNGLYQDDILNSLLESVVGLIVDYAEIIENAGALLGAESISKWFDYCEITTDENGETVVTVTHDFGIDEAATNEEKRELFVEAFVDVLEPAYRLLAWLLFAEDFTFFNASNGDVLITLKGGRGYEMGLAPLLEAVGAVMPEDYSAPVVVPGSADYPYTKGESGIKAVSEFYDENGELDMEQATRDVFTALTDWLNMICGDLKNQREYGTIGTMLELLPNVVYNLNAGTLDAVICNLLLPVEEILTHLKGFGVELSIHDLLGDLGITSYDWYGVFALVEELVNLYWPANIQEFLATLYLGKVVEFTSASGEKAYFMTYNEGEMGENSEYLESSRADMLTLVISFVVDGALDPRNEEQLVDWIGQDVYDVIYAYISHQAKTVEMQKFDWLFTDKVGETLSPLTVGSEMGEIYGELYTKEMGAYIEKWLPSFVDTMIVLLGVEAEDGDTYAGLEDILNELVGETIYTKANLEAILELLKSLAPMIRENLDAELVTVITDVLKSALGIDLTYWDEYAIADFTDGDRDAFVDELIRMLEPTYPILAWLLTDEDLVALFNTADGKDAIVIEGAEGYAYGIIPLLEAFDYDNELIKTPDEFKAAANGDPEMLLRNILEPLLNVVDRVLADPVNEIFEVLPGVIYFLNSNGLDTVIKNTANAIFTVLENIEPLTGEIDVYELIGFQPTEINIDTIIEQLLADLEESTGLEFKDTALQAVRELTLGEVVEYTSKNGNTAYTMVYADEENRNDMVSVVLRAALSIVTVEENAESIKAMLKDELSEEGYDFVESLLDNFVQMAESEGGMEEIMYTVYQIFYAANVAAHKTENWLGEFNGDYTFIGDLFATSELPFLQQLGKELGGLLNNDITGDIIGSEGLAPNGFIKFFESIRNFFQKILDFFTGLFN